ncbi:hypothetical protein [Shewanella algae]|uniref:hypothetical protein n=1 Tax=Shewanella algae TaxID=38313 RepID=UPI00313A9AC9
MAIPWLIGAGIVAAGAVVAKKLSSNNSQSTSGGSSETATERRERARRERRERESAEKLAALQSEYTSEGNDRAESLKSMLSGAIKVSYLNEQPFAASLTEKGRLKQREVTEHCVEIHQITALDDLTIDNLAAFETLYAAELTPTPELLMLCDETSKQNAEYRELHKLKLELEKALQKLD